MCVCSKTAEVLEGVRRNKIKARKSEKTVTNWADQIGVQGLMIHNKMPYLPMFQSHFLPEQKGR